MIFAVITGCSDTSKDGPAQKPAPTLAPDVEQTEADILRNACMQGRKQGGQAASSKEGRDVMELAVKACQDYLAIFPRGKDRNQVDALIGEARSWLGHYSNLVNLDELMEQKQFTDAKRLLASVKDSLPESEISRVSTLIAASESLELEARMPGLSAYAKGLRVKYASRLLYKTEFAKRVVEDFNLDCKAQDGRYLPLSNVLYAKLASLDGDTGHLIIEVDSRGEDVRVTDYLIGKDGEVMHSSIGYEINKWRELRTVNTRLEAVRNSCFGGYGEIWIIPSR